MTEEIKFVKKYASKLNTSYWLHTKNLVIKNKSFKATLKNILINLEIKKSWTAHQIINNNFNWYFLRIEDFMHYVFISCQKWRKRRSWKPNYQKNGQKRRTLHDFCRFIANTWAISNLASISLIAMFHIADREFSNGNPSELLLLLKNWLKVYIGSPVI